MEKFGKAQAFRRIEDVRFLTGHGSYIDDDVPEGALHGFFLRSTVAHATITELDVEEARALDGVVAVYTLADMEAAGAKVTMGATRLTNRDGSRSAHPERPVLARDKLRYVGEAIAFIVAETAEAARDAAEMIELDFDDLPAHIGLSTGGEPLHADVPDNLAFDWAMGDEAKVEARIASAAHVIEMDIEDTRVMVSPMEPRGAWAAPEDGRLHFAFSGQGVWDVRDLIAESLGLPKGDVRVTTPDVGGGFGMKAPPYPEYLVIAFAAHTLGRPVRWFADRTESMLADHGGRDLRHHSTLALDEDLKIVAYKVETICNMGAYNQRFGQGIQTELFSKVLAGVYDVQDTWLAVKGVFTNTTMVEAYRGAGRPEAIYALERIMDRAARELGVDPWELRRRNFITPEAMPYTSATGETYDVGDFARVLARVEEVADRAGFAARRADSAARGKLRGQGLCYYIESILGDPSEDATVEFTEEGGARLYVGTQSNGQGHETVYAKFLSDQTGIPFEKIEVIQGDTDRIARGGGTGGSRSVTTQNNATLATVGTLLAAYGSFFAAEAGVDEGAVRFDDEVFRAEGSNWAPGLLELAAKAREAGRDDLMRFTETAKLPARSYPNGAHVAEVEIDPDTGISQVVSYAVTDDFGNLINPLLVEGQVQGGIAQGLGQIMMERVVHDEDGQLLTATFMDYAMPRASDMPVVVFTTEAVPSTANVMGMKGCGEAGTVGAMAAVGNAMQDALWEHGVRQADMPFTPERVWRMLASATAA